MSSKPKLLFYDIESLPLQAYVWGCGDQVIRHQQLIPGKSTWGLICITYCWNDGGPVKIIKWTPEGGTKAMIEEFDKLIAEADHTIGKNSDRFDVKMINTHRMLQELPGNPSWSKYTDDLEKQMRKYFRLPSQSLDYISAQLGFGGKVKMEFSDWVAIDRYREVETYLRLFPQSQAKLLDIITELQYEQSVEEIIKLGKKAVDKMCFYGKKDTRDTRALWNVLKEHFEPKLNFGAFKPKEKQLNSCKQCGSNNTKSNGTRVSGKQKWQTYLCNDCFSYAGRKPFGSNDRVLV